MVLVAVSLRVCISGLLCGMHVCLLCLCIRGWAVGFRFGPPAVEKVAVCRWSQLETSCYVMVFYGAVGERLAAVLYLQHAHI